MANLIKLAAGGVASWTAAGFTTAADWNNLANGNAVIARSAINPGLDQYTNVSMNGTAAANTAAGAVMLLFILPLNRDGSTYGDNRGTSDGAISGMPGFAYLAGIMPVRSGITAFAGTFIGRGVNGLIEAPRFNFLFAVGNGLGGALAASPSVTVEYQTTLLNLNG